MSDETDIAGTQANPVASSRTERAIFARFVLGDEDSEGLLAFGLHRRAFLDWQDAYSGKHGVAPDSAAIDSFLLGETHERRIRDYRERANLMMASSAEPAEPVQGDRKIPAPKPRPLRTWFWPWGFPSGFVVENPDQPINWKGLFWRLLLLLLAVVVTAVLLRVLVVRGP